MREIRTSGSMRGGRKRAFAWRACLLLYSAPNLRIRREATSLDAPTVLLELSRRHVAQSRVQSLLIVDAFQELTDLRVGVSQVAVLGAINLFVLQCFHERLAGRVVIGVTFAAHADLDAVLLQQAGVVVRSILHATIGMMRQSR